MKKSIRIFKTMEEQQQFHLELMRNSTATERFRKLYQMQQMNLLLHPVSDKVRKIQIGKWTS